MIKGTICLRGYIDNLKVRTTPKSTNQNQNENDKFVTGSISVRIYNNKIKNKETKVYQYFSLIFNNKKLIEKIENNKVKNGNFVSIFGSIGASYYEVNGEIKKQFSLKNIDNIDVIEFSNYSVSENEKSNSETSETDSDIKKEEENKTELTTKETKQDSEVDSEDDSEESDLAL